MGFSGTGLIFQDESVMAANGVMSVMKLMHTSPFVLDAFTRCTASNNNKSLYLHPVFLTLSAHIKGKNGAGP